MKTKHTKGEWIVAPNGTHIIVINEVFKSLIIAETDFNIQTIGRSKCEANAKLIAAAPEMLKALMDVESNLGYYDLELLDESALQAIENAKKAIKKAIE